ncbi:tetratricopeptide repeat protein [Tautonia marina]|uniref:tetratricopeptide repeat protein n=1 Tax=Tautonia marina TaxID=2653855 RepID=UPI00137618B5|nr:tetratricopeptide repeat protein [Tautonia marina]
MERSRWLGLMVVAVVLLLGVVTVYWWQGRPERHLQEAERLLEDGSPIEALQWLDVPAKEPETRPRALLLRARAAIDRGRPSEAVEPLDQIDAEGPLAAETAFWKGRTLMAAGQTLRAAVWFQDALRRRPDQIETLRWLAAASYELGDLSTAIDSLETLTRLQPGDAPAWRTMGLIQKEHAEYEEARDAYQASLKANADQPDVRMELAEVLMELSRHDEAIRLLEACRGRVNEPDRLVLLARSLYEVGERADARHHLEQGLNAVPDDPAMLAERARIDLAEGNFSAAVEALDEALGAEPINPDGFYLRSQAHRRLGHPEQADQDLARSQELTEVKTAISNLIREADQSPDSAEVRYRLGTLCLELNDSKMAAAWFQAALACDPNHEAARQGLLSLRWR